MNIDRICGMIELERDEAITGKQRGERAWLHTNEHEVQREAYTTMVKCTARAEALTWVLSLLDTIVHPPAPPRKDRSTVDLLVELFEAEPETTNWSLQVLADRVGRSKASVAKAKTKAYDLYMTRKG